jgi:preprotein translocase subunit YajC
VNTIATILGASSSNSGSPLGILILVIPFGLLIWLMVVPQRKQKAKQQQLLSNIDVGDEVITTGGIVGVITHLDDDLVHLEVDHDVVIRVAKSSIGRTLEEPTDDGSDVPKRGLLGGLMGGGAAASASADTSKGSATSKNPATSKGSSTPARSSAKKK